MPSYNKVILMGHLTRDPEMKYLTSGTAVTNFGMAMNEKYTDKQTGETKETPCFVEITCWARTAEVANEYLSKGDPVFIEGSLKFDSWETDQGDKRSKLSVTAFRLQLMGKRESAPPGGAGGQVEQQEMPGVPEATSDDIPF